MVKSVNALKWAGLQCFSRYGTKVTRIIITLENILRKHTCAALTLTHLVGELLPFYFSFSPLISCTRVLVWGWDDFNTMTRASIRLWTFWSLITVFSLYLFLQLPPIHNKQHKLLFIYTSDIKFSLFLAVPQWLVGSQFPDQGLNLGHGSESPES